MLREDDLRAGCVWRGLIDFHDGRGPTPKYYVVIGECDGRDEKVSVAITTSRSRYPNMGASHCGCPAESCFRIDEGQEPCFNKTTWVQLDSNQYEIRKSKLAEAEKEGHKCVGRMDPERTRSLLKCAQHSVDIDGRNKARIASTYKRLLAALKEKAKPVHVAPTATAQTPLQRLYRARCGKCRAGVASLLGIAEAELEALVTESKVPPPSLEDVEVGFQLMSTECDCAAAKPSTS